MTLPEFVEALRASHARKPYVLTDNLDMIRRIDPIDECPVIGVARDLGRMWGFDDASGQCLLLASAEFLGLSEQDTKEIFIAADCKTNTSLRPQLLAAIGIIQS